jgi:glutathione S-transferase
MARPPVLWQYNFSNFNEKARWALDYKGVAHVRRSLLPNMPRALMFSLRGTLPVLDLDGERVVDSTRIIDALERRQPQPPLYPEDAAERVRALALEDFFDEHAGHELRRALFYEQRDNPDYVSALLTTGRGPATRRVYRQLITMPGAMTYAKRRYRFYADDAERSQTKVREALDRIVAEQGADGYMVSGRFSVADLTAASLLYPLAWPAQLQYDYPDPPDSELMRSLAEHPGVAWIAEMYRRHRGASMEVTPPTHHAAASPSSSE